VPDIFLSYNREDQARARLFAEEFEAQGYEVWWDATLRSGEAYDQVTEKALKDARAVVVLWSKRSVQSRWVRAEATLADRNKTLLPVMIEPCERPIMFELTQTADLVHWQGARDDKAWLAFLEDLRRFVGAARRPPIATASASLPVRPLEPVLAVLAFDNLSDDREMQFFSDGISEEIIQRLSRGARMKVIGRASSFQFRGDRKAEAPRALNCSHVLDGSVRRAGDKVRIVVQLVEAATQTTLWSSRYDRSLEDVFALQDEISKRIAAALNRTIAKTTAYVIDAQSFDLYLRSRAQRFTPDGWRASITLLEGVVRRRPQFAPAWGWLAMRKALLRWSCAPHQFAALTAAANLDAKRALAVDPSDLTALSAQYQLKPMWGEFLQGEAIIAQMASVSSNDPELHLFTALFRSRVGHLRAALDSSWRFYELDPLNPLAIVWLGACLMRRGELAETREVFERALAGDPSGDVVNLIITYAFQKEPEAADRLMNSVQYRNLPEPERTPVSEFVAATRDPTARRRFVDAVREEVDQTGAIDLREFSLLAYFDAVDEAYEFAARVRFRPIGDGTELKGVRAYQTWNLFGFWAERLRQDARFPALCARFGLVEYWTTTGKWPDCADEVPYDFRAECSRPAPA
jgi:TolB-like protein